jgi:hypothetical protein
MTLENVLKALEFSMKGDLASVDESFLTDRNVQETLTTYFTESEVRPHLIQSIKIPSLMLEYLNLPLQVKESVPFFANDGAAYFSGDISDRVNLGSKNENVGKLVRKIRATNQLLDMFDHYIENREGLQEFTATYVRRMFPKGDGVIKTAQKIFDLDSWSENFDELLSLVSEVRPEIEGYKDYRDIFLREAPYQLLEIFEFYKRNRKPEQRFNGNYISTEEKVREKFGTLGKRINDTASNILGPHGGFLKFLELTSKMNPDILNYTTQAGLRRVE